MKKLNTTPAPVLTSYEVVVEYYEPCHKVIHVSASSRDEAERRAIEAVYDSESVTGHVIDCRPTKK
jgi:hypothetical protein